ncbi:hypothetical protein LCGC14_2529300 [marine sediment metagenome]|uniref:Uncharacterized protein n=1 Tax=marine sediment metagenome TaxID=412755 RepID=A0A0F9AU19_9ZZZZ
MKKNKTCITEFLALIFIFVFLTWASGAKLQRTQLFPSTGRLKPSDEIQDPYIKQQFTNVKEWADKLQQFLDTTFRKVAKIPFNQSESLTVADTGNVNTEFSITHHLGRVPNGFIITKSDKACNVYDSGTTWTTSLVYLKCDIANTALSLKIF